MKIKNLILFSALTMTSLAQAAKEVGNGGDGVELEGRTYVLDLVEAGVEDNAYFAPIDADPRIVERLRTTFSGIDWAPVDLLAQKLTEIQNISNVSALIILKTMEFYSWRTVSSALLDVPDEDTSLSIPRGKLIQLAIRRNTSILIDRDAWLKLDAQNRAALVFHEALYALVTPELLAPRPGYYYEKRYAQLSFKAREIVGYLFTTALSARGWQGLHNIAPDLTLLPSKGFQVINEYSNTLQLNKLAAQIYFVGTQPVVHAIYSAEDEVKLELDLKASDFTYFRFHIYEFSHIKIEISKYETRDGNLQNYVKYSLEHGRFSKVIELDDADLARLTGNALYKAATKKIIKALN